MDDSVLQGESLAQKACRIRRHIVRMIGGEGKTGHLGGSLSAVELVTVLYFHTLRHRPDDPHWPERDRFILSKGHAALVQYAALAEAGYFPVETLDTAKQLGSLLQGHPDRHKTPGVEANTGSLGQGLSLGVGMALGLRMEQSPSRVYVLLGDGELNEGQVWEAAACAAHYGLQALTAIVDVNGLQASGRTAAVLSPMDLEKKWRAFGWQARWLDGHAPREIMEGYAWASRTEGPCVLLARTTKGKGIPFAEDAVQWHNRSMTQAEYDLACQALMRGEEAR